MVQTPENMLSAISTNPQIQCLAVSVVGFPDCLARTFPSLGDGIAHKDQVDVSLVGLNVLIELFVAFHPTTFPWCGRDG